MKFEKVYSLIISELRKAEKKHPEWPKDKIHAAAILAEESGELIQAAIDYEYLDNGKINSTIENNYIEHMKNEAAQCGAVAIRFLINMGD